MPIADGVAAIRIDIAADTVYSESALKGAHFIEPGVPLPELECDHALPGPNRQAVLRQTFPRSRLRQGSSECRERAARSVLVDSRARHARGIRGAARREADFGSTPSWRLAQCLRWWQVACIDVVAG